MSPRGRVTGGEGPRDGELGSGTPEGLEAEWGGAGDGSGCRGRREDIGGRLSTTREVGGLESVVGKSWGECGDVGKGVGGEYAYRGGGERT